jgi:hypothetical protein
LALPGRSELSGADGFGTVDGEALGVGLTVNTGKTIRACFDLGRRQFQWRTKPLLGIGSGGSYGT